jgi:hypothetical protein
VTTLTHLQRLEAESIQIFREAVSESERPVMLYSVGKDSAVMLHLALKAFAPSLPPFQLLHVDTTYKFQAMYAHRERMVKESGMELLVHTNPEGLKEGVNPFTHGSSYHTDVMKTQALKQVLEMPCGGVGESATDAQLRGLVRDWPRPDVRLGARLQVPPSSTTTLWLLALAACALLLELFVRRQAGVEP